MSIKNCCLEYDLWLKGSETQLLEYTRSFREWIFLNYESLFIFFFFLSISLRDNDTTYRALVISPFCDSGGSTSLKWNSGFNFLFFYRFFCETLSTSNAIHFSIVVLKHFRHTIFYTDKLKRDAEYLVICFHKGIQIELRLKHYFTMFSEILKNEVFCSFMYI